MYKNVSNSKLKVWLFNLKSTEQCIEAKLQNLTVVLERQCKQTIIKSDWDDPINNGVVIRVLLWGLNYLLPKHSGNNHHSEVIVGPAAIHFWSLCSEVVLRTLWAPEVSEYLAMLQMSNAHVYVCRLGTE